MFFVTAYGDSFYSQTHEIQEETYYSYFVVIESQYNMKFFDQYFRQIEKYLHDFTEDKELNISTKLTTPKGFKDLKSIELYKFLSNNWNYSSDIKYTYLYEFIFDLDNYNVTYKADYESTVRGLERFNGKFNYGQANSEKRFDELRLLLAQFENVE